MTEVTTSAEPAIAPVPAGSSWFVRWRYWILGALVLVGVASQSRNQQWTTDMWMHAAAVRELAARPFHPGDPVISAVHDSAWLNPYAWMVGRLAAALDGNALAALSIAAVGNVALVLVAFRAFVVELTANRRAPFYALVAALLLWGVRAWRWSGVIHLDSIGYVAPYPSMFALAVLLGVLTIASRLARLGVVTADWWRLTALGAGVALVALCHPPTGVVLAVVGPVLVLCRLRPWSWATLAWLALPVVLGLALTSRWPWFPLFGLSSDGFYATSDELFYQAVPQRVFPALLGLVVLYRRSRADWRDPLAWLAGAALALYAIGHWTGIGRPIIFAMLVMQIAVGDGLGRIEAAWSSGRAVARWQQLYVGASVLLAVLGLVVLRAGPVRMIPEEIRPSGLASKDELVKVSDTYRPIGDQVDDSVVMASETPSVELPAFGGRLVSSAFWENPLAANDITSRRQATKEFFRASTSAERRREILDEYDVRYVVVSTEDDARRDAMGDAGLVGVDQRGDLVLYWRPPDDR